MIPHTEEFDYAAPFAELWPDALREEMAANETVKSGYEEWAAKQAEEPRYELRQTPNACWIWDHLTGYYAETESGKRFPLLLSPEAAAEAVAALNEGHDPEEVLAEAERVVRAEDETPEDARWSEEPTENLCWSLQTAVSHTRSTLAVLGRLTAAETRGLWRLVAEIGREESTGDEQA